MGELLRELQEQRQAGSTPTLPDSEISGAVKQLGFRKVACGFSVLLGL